MVTDLTHLRQSLPVFVRSTISLPVVQDAFIFTCVLVGVCVYAPSLESMSALPLKRKEVVGVHARCAIAPARLASSQQ